MKYCMSCDPATEMRPSPDAQIVECPTCGRRDLLPLLPLLVVTGASGAGKSTVFPYLVDLLPTCAVFEMDLILEYASATWDNLRSTWLMLAHGVALNGQPTVLCGSLLPDQLEALPARQLVGPIHFANLDADDHLLAQRLSARPAWRGWNEARIKEHQDFASHLRRTIEPTFSTTDADPASVASQVAAWVEARL